MNENNPYRSPETERGPDWPLLPAKQRPTANLFGLASLLCALIFPVAFWGVIMALVFELTVSPIIVGVILTASSIAALALGLLSLKRSVTWTALTGVVLGTVYIFMLLAFLW